MKILLYSISSPHEITGIGKYNGELVEWLWENGHQADVMSTLPYYPYWEIYDEYKSDSYKVEEGKSGKIYSVRLPVSKNVSSLRRVWMDLVLMLKTCFRVFYLSIKNRYDVIVLVLPPLSIFPVAILAKYISGAKLHVHIQDLQIEAAREMNLLPGPLLSILEQIEKICFYFVDFVTSISDNMVAQVRNKISRSSIKIEVIENWADTESIQPIEENKWLKHEYGFSEDTFLVVYSGNIGEKQGVEQILPVAKELKQREQNIQILILGDGANKEQLLVKSNEMKLNNVTYGNLVPKEKLNLMLNGSDVQLILQRKEATDSFLPSKYINILSAGVPSIVTAHPQTELHKIVTSNKTSLLIYPEKSALLAKAIRTLATKNCLREELAENSRRFACQKFGKDSILKRLINHYKNLIS